MTEIKVKSTDIPQVNTEESKIKSLNAAQSQIQEKSRAQTVTVLKKESEKISSQTKNNQRSIINQRIKTLANQHQKSNNLYIQEVQWNNRFINDTIPELFKKKRRVTEHINRNRPLQLAYVDKQRPKLPELLKEKLQQNATKNNRKRKIQIDRLSMIKHMRKQEGLIIKQKEQEKIKQIKQIKEVKNKIIYEEKEKSVKKISHKNKKKERLLLKLQEKTKIFTINPHYKALLIDLINKATQSKHKTVRTTIQKQIDTIGGFSNTYCKLQKMVQERKSLLKVIEAGSVTLKQYLDLQFNSLILVEEILKFKAQWEAIYHDVLHQPTRVHFYYAGTNYLLQMNQEVTQISPNDPFLVANTAALIVQTIPQEQQSSQRKETMLKIRACELLLIQEELLASP